MPSALSPVLVSPSSYRTRPADIVTDHDAMTYDRSHLHRAQRSRTIPARLRPRAWRRTRLQVGHRKDCRCCQETRQMGGTARQQWIARQGCEEHVRYRRYHRRHESYSELVHERV